MRLKYISLIFDLDRVICTSGYRVRYHKQVRPSIQMNQETNTMAAASTERPAYVFPHRRLKRVMSDPDRDPLVLVACGTAKTYPPK